MEEKRNQLAEKLNEVIAKLYEEFNSAAMKRDVNEMLEISDRINSAAEVLVKIYGIGGIEEQIVMLEKAISEAQTV